MTGASFADLPIFPSSVAWEDAQNELDRLGLGDGLPLVPPTRERLEPMRRGLEAFGNGPRLQVPPLLGELTPEAVAYNAVLAGCVPGEGPVILAAVTACLEPQFNLLGIQTTTGCATVAVIVHGGLVSSLDLNAGGNCLGPGNRGNACIGRAVHLCLTNIGGARPGVGDMATIGQPGKYTFCLAETDAELDGWPPLHRRRGADGSGGAVTVFGAAGTIEVLPDGNPNTPETIIHPLQRVIDAVRGGRPMEHLVLMPPELATALSRMGVALHNLAMAFSPAEVVPLVTGGPGVKMLYIPAWGGGTRSVTRIICV